MMEQQGWISAVVIGFYFLFLMSIGALFKRLNKDESDYFRAGARGAWWMVGMSLLMSSISTQTFIANAGVAYRSGFSIHWIYLVNLVCYMIMGLGVAAWYRQARVTTFAEIVRDRFGVFFEQFFTYYSVIWLMQAGGLGLYMLALFARAVFGFPIEATIIALILIVMFYTLTGGNWAVLAADFLQGLVLFSMTILLAVLCLQATGGVSGFFELIREQGLTTDFNLVTPGREDGLYGWEWLIGVAFAQVYGIMGMAGGQRYFACKTGGEARKAAWFCAGVTLLGTLVYFIPPMAARLLFHDEVMALDTAAPQDVSYAFMSMKLLPFGFVPLMAVAMFSAQMSSMDTALNANAALFVKNAYPALMRKLGRVPSEDHRFLLAMGRVFTVLIGIGVLAFSFYFARSASREGVFELSFRLGSLFLIPMMLSLFLGVFVRNTPRWSGWACFAASFIAAWTCQAAGMPTYRMAMINSAVGITVFFLSKLVWKKTPAAEQEQVNAFFRQLHTPVDFEKEVGGDNDAQQLYLIGILALCLSAFIALFLLLPNPVHQRMQILWVSLAVGAVGLLLLLVRRSVIARGKGG